MNRTFILTRLGIARAAALAVFSTMLLPSDALAQSSPSAFTSGTRYDLDRRVTGTIAPDPDGSGAIRFAATRNSYDARGLLIKVETGELANWQSEAVAPASWSGFTVFRTVESVYDAMGRKLRDTVLVGGVPQQVSQTSYTATGDVECTAVRLNPATFAALPTSACTLSTPTAGGSFGPDRITRNVYVPGIPGRVQTVQRAYGTPLQQDYVSYTYTANGQVGSVTDANGGTASYSYDGHDRLRRWNFPSPTTAGIANPTDYEEYSYNASGLRTSLRKRDGSTLTYQYDALRRNTVRIVPERGGLSPAQTRDVYTSFDNRGLVTAVRFDAANGSDGVSSVYDAAGRPTSASHSMGGTARTLSYQWNRNGARTRVTHPDGVYVSYDFDGLGRVTGVRENGATLLASYAFNSRSELTGLGRGGAATTLTYDSLSRPTAQTHDLGGSSGDVTTAFTYSPVNQIITRTRSNDAYVYAGDVDVARTYTVNGLNQYLSAGPATFTYDANGNLTSDSSTTFTYDIENRLVAATGARTATLVYDVLGRLFETSGGTAGVTRFLYDGDELIAEYTSAGMLLRRYVHGAAVDDPLIWYEGGAVSTTNRRQLFADHQGSIIAVADGGGALLSINRYDDWGVPDGLVAGQANMGRFQYTGQAWIPELGMYYYKARIYSPTLGRFMQTDPIGYADQFNLYAYVGNDPVNARDPSGTTCKSLKSGDGYECRVDRFTDSRGNPISRSDLSRTQQRQVTAFERRYSAAVNRIASLPNRTVTVGSSGNIGGRPVGSFEISRQQALGNLTSRTFSAGRAAVNGGVLENSGGWVPMLNASNAVTTVTAEGLAAVEGSPSFFEMAVVHDAALHGSRQEYSGTFGIGGGAPNDSGLGREPFRTGHQTPYNNASCALLGISCD